MFWVDGIMKLPENGRSLETELLNTLLNKFLVKMKDVFLFLKPKEFLANSVVCFSKYRCFKIKHLH